MTAGRTRLDAGVKARDTGLCVTYEVAEDCRRMCQRMHPSKSIGCAAVNGRGWVADGAVAGLVPLRRQVEMNGGVANARMCWERCSTRYAMVAWRSNGD